MIMRTAAGLKSPAEARTDTAMGIQSQSHMPQIKWGSATEAHRWIAAKIPVINETAGNDLHENCCQDQEMNGAVDGARTRDLRRDRPAL